MLHGGDIYSEGIFKGQELLDFSSNINPLGVPDSFKVHIEEALNNVKNYPDILYRGIKSDIKEYLDTVYAVNLHENSLVIGNGAAEIIDLSISCFKKLLVVVPSFVEYNLNAKKWGAAIEYSYLNEDMDFDYGDILKKLENNEAIIIGNPNNPNGNIIDKKYFKSILDYCELNHKTVIIDEAFIEFTGDPLHSFTTLINKYKCLFIIRAITKFFAMPGIRFGYGISKNEEIIRVIKAMQNPWNINCFAETAVKYVFKDKEYIDKSIKWINEERIFFTDELRNIEIIDKIYKTYSNFVLCRLREIDCDEIYSFCLSEKILIRKADNFMGLNKNYIRLAIKDREKNKRLLEILKKFPGKF